MGAGRECNAVWKARCEIVVRGWENPAKYHMRQVQAQVACPRELNHTVRTVLEQTIMRIDLCIRF